MQASIVLMAVSAAFCLGSVAQAESAKLFSTANDAHGRVWMFIPGRTDPVLITHQQPRLHPLLAASIAKPQVDPAFLTRPSEPGARPSMLYSSEQPRFEAPPAQQHQQPAPTPPRLGAETWVEPHYSSTLQEGMARGAAAHLNAQANMLMAQTQASQHWERQMLTPLQVAVQKTELNNKLRRLQQEQRQGQSRQPEVIREGNEQNLARHAWRIAANGIITWPEFLLQAQYHQDTAAFEREMGLLTSTDPGQAFAAAERAVIACDQLRKRLQQDSANTSIRQFSTARAFLECLHDLLTHVTSGAADEKGAQK